MQTKFIQTDSLYEADKEAPWACEIIKVEGGYMTFDRDWETS